MLSSTAWSGRAVVARRNSFSAPARSPTAAYAWASSTTVSRPRLGPDSRDLYAEIHRELDRLLLPRVLEYTGGNQQRSALLLGIARRTLRAKLQDVGLHVTQSVEADDGNVP